MPNCGFSWFFFSIPLSFSFASCYLVLFKNMLCAFFSLGKQKKDAIIVVPLHIYNSSQSSHSLHIYIDAPGQLLNIPFLFV